MDTPAARHALRILQHLARHAEPRSARSIARELDLPRSSIYKLLGTLAEEGFISHLADEQRYGLGLAAFELGSAYSRQAPLQRLARTVLARLVDHTTHNAHLAVLHGREVLYVIEERAPGRPPLVSDVGVRLPAALTASGLALLAALPRAQVRALFPDDAAFVSRTATGADTPRALQRALVEVRRQGYAWEQDSVSPGFASVAEAVRDHNQHPVAAVTVTFPGAEVGEVERGQLVDAVRSAAADLTRRLGPR